MNKMLVIFLAIIALSACESSELHESMEEMGDTYEAMSKTEDLAVIKEKYADLKAYFDIAVVQQVAPEEQATFKEGMDKTADLLARLDAAIAAEDLEDAKNIMQQMGEISEEYHDKLEVE